MLGICILHFAVLAACGCLCELGSFLCCLLAAAWAMMEAKEIQTIKP
jgi:hypothetical protein